jgi:hypothetical protein
LASRCVAQTSGSQIDILSPIEGSILVMSCGLAFKIIFIAG